MKARILMIAYACNPQGSGEHWLGWGWAEQAARGFQVVLITTPNYRAAVEARARECGIIPHFVAVPEWFRRFTLRLGGAGSWLRKISWQSHAVSLARSLHGRNPFALVHQTTFHTFRVPFRAVRLGIPSVWGPIAGGEFVPPGFSRYLGAARISEFVRKLFNRFWLHFPPIKHSLRDASVIFVSNRTTLGFLPATIREKCQVVPPNALRPEDESREPGLRPKKSPNDPFRLLYVGNCVATRAIPLVFDALVESNLRECKFTIVGDGPALDCWKQLAGRLGLSGMVDFTGKVPYSELPPYYAGADALVFPALRDSGGSALLEAMSRLLPVICLDWAGPGEMVDHKSGIKIPVDNPGLAVRKMAEAFLRLRQDHGLAESLARAARKRADELFRWDAKFRLLESNYSRLIQKR